MTATRLVFVSDNSFLLTAASQRYYCPHKQQEITKESKMSCSNSVTILGHSIDLQPIILESTKCQIGELQLGNVIRLVKLQAKDASEYDVVKILAENLKSLNTETKQSLAGIFQKWQGLSKASYGTRVAVRLAQKSLRNEGEQNNSKFKIKFQEFFNTIKLWRIRKWEIAMFVGIESILSKQTSDKIGPLQNVIPPEHFKDEVLVLSSKVEAFFKTIKEDEEAQKALIESTKKAEEELKKTVLEAQTAFSSVTDTLTPVKRSVEKALMEVKALEARAQALSKSASEAAAEAHMDVKAIEAAATRADKTAKEIISDARPAQVSTIQVLDEIKEALKTAEAAFAAGSASEASVNQAIGAQLLSSQREAQKALDDARLVLEQLVLVKGQIEKTVATATAAREQYQKRLRTAKEKAKIEKELELQRMYEGICSDEGMRSKLPRWNAFAGIVAEKGEGLSDTDLDSRLQNLDSLFGQLTLASEYAQRLSALSERQGESAPTALMAQLMVMGRRPLLKNVLAATSHDDVATALDEYVKKFLESPNSSEHGFSVLLDQFKARDGISEEEFLDSLVQVIQKNNPDILISAIQKQLGEQTPLKQTFLTKLKKTSTVELSDLSFRNEDLLRDTLFKMIVSAHQTPDGTALFIQEIGAAVAVSEDRKQQVVSLLSFLFSWFPQESTEIREGIRSFSKIFEDHSRVSTCGIDSNVAKAITSLADGLHVVGDGESTYCHSASVHMALVFHAAPDTSSHFSFTDEGVTRSRIALELGLDRLKEEGVAKDSSIHPFFVGTEWNFMASGYENVIELMDKMACISRDHPGVVYIPGSIGWFEPSVNLCFNVLPIFENGRLVALYSKRHEKMDMSTIAGIYKKEEGQLYWAANRYPKVFDAFIRNTFVLGNGLAVGTEICNDHVYGSVKSDYEQESPSGQGLDVHIVMAHGTQLSPHKLALRPSAGGVGYIDHSDRCQTTASLVRCSGSGNVLQDPRQTINASKDALGGYVTHQWDGGEISPVFLKLEESLTSRPIEQKPSCLLRAIDPPVNVQELIDYVKAHASTLYPNREKPKASFGTEDDFSAALTSTLTRYTFADQQDVDLFLAALQQDLALENYRTQFLQCLSALLNRPIILYPDLASIDRQIIMPDRSKPLSMPENAIELCFSFAEKKFYCPSWKDCPEYCEIRTKCEEVVQHESGAKTQEDFERISVSIGAIRTRVKEVNSIAARKAFLEFSEKMDAIQKRIDTSIVERTFQGMDPTVVGFNDIIKTFQPRREPSCTSITQCLEEFATLQQFQEMYSPARGIWVDTESGKLQCKSVVFKQDPSKITGKLLELQFHLRPFLRLFPKATLQKMKDCLISLQTSYPKNRGIQDTVNEFVGEINQVHDATAETVKE